MLPFRCVLSVCLERCAFVKRICVVLAEAYETQEPQQQKPNRGHNDSSYRAFVTSIQCPINISQAHSNGLSDISGLSGNILVAIEPYNHFYIVNIKLFMDNFKIPNIYQL